MNRKDVIKMHQSSEKEFDKPNSQIFGNVFYLCKNHIASLVKDLLRGLGIKHPNNLKKCDERKVEKALSLVNSMETKRNPTRENFFNNLEQMVSYEYEELLSLYGVNVGERCPQVEENTQDEVQDEELIEDESMEEESGNEEIENSEDEQEVKEENEEEHVPDELKDLPEESSYKIEIRKRKSTPITRTFERQESWTPSDHSSPLTQSSKSDYGSDLTRKKLDLKKMRQCKICKARGIGADLSGAWSKYFVLHTALERDEIDTARCSAIYESGTRLFICNYHAKLTAEKLCRCFGVINPIDFDAAYHKPTVKSAVEQLAAEIKAMFEVGKLEIRTFIKQARNFVIAHGKVIKPHNLNESLQVLFEEISPERRKILTRRRSSMDIPTSSSAPKRFSPGKATSKKRAFVDGAHRESSSPSPRKNPRLSSSPTNTPGPSSSKRRKRRKCHVCEVSVPEQELVTFSNRFDVICMLATLHFCRNWEEDIIKHFYATKILVATKPKMHICVEHAREAGPDMLQYLQIENIDQALDVSYDRTHPLRQLFKRIDNSLLIPIEFEGFIDKCMGFVTKCRSRGA
uniref:Chromo domain-containing protein n=1 Tax=Caenorhabditis tropicalis TaxID=1561998 RepID=A0A1I7T095_9PELO